MVIFLPFASPKIPTSKNLFPTLSTQVFPVSPPFYLLALCYLSMFIMLFVLSTPLNENDDVIYGNGKSWLKSSHELDAHFTFYCIQKDESL